MLCPWFPLRPPPPEMSKGLRTHIRDVQLRLDGVLGTGAYGTVYSGGAEGDPP